MNAIIIITALPWMLSPRELSVTVIVPWIVCAKSLSLDCDQLNISFATRQI
jgi:hypothetical protein